ncbi:MAG TPA: GFA family protein, partial [Caulobacteraceae bacterium]|nr:GFA family protein [Caulobacteraceae bacterium]
MTTRTASCSCGQLAIEVEGEPRGVGLCHCLACQRRTGSVFAALASFRPPWRVTGKATEYVRTGDHGSRFRFRFCPVCGTSLFHTEEGYEDRSVSVAVGAFADPSFPPPSVSVYDSRRHPWVILPPG